MVLIESKSRGFGAPALRVTVATVVLALCIGLGTPTAAWAAEPNPAEVEELIRQGNELRRKGKDFAAVAFFQKAYDLERSARTAAQLGLVESNLGYWMASERHLSEALAFPRHPWMVQHRAEIEKTLAHVQSYIGEIEVTGTPAGAELLVNGRPAGNLPLAAPVRVPEGVMQLALRAPGHTESTRSVRVAGGKREVVRFALEPARTSSSGAPILPTDGQGQETVAGRAPGSELGMRTGSDQVGDAPGWVRPAAWVATAGSALALSVGTYGVLRQRSKRDEFADYVGPNRERCSTKAMNQGGAGCPTIYNEANAAARLAIVGFVAGGALAAGAILGFVMSNGGSSDADLAWTVAVGPGQAGFGYRGRF